MIYSDLCNDRDMFSGNSVDIAFDCNSVESEIKADVVLFRTNSVRVWGQIITEDGVPVTNALIKLVREELELGKTVYRGIAHTISDCQGFYQFDICGNSNTIYKVLVGKANTGPEKVINTYGGNCSGTVINSCGQSGYSNRIEEYCINNNCNDC